eukprot:NODE_4211_length_487_cov_13.826484_g3607_i0.p4 GENE.NODE_4211_length_487_cov_13.826484_g3607_i0~~NODE_4211_length_487_cov_13.826484_g3607_i0.p4  ORF type:complete len:69 (-),score=22.07 NODE_4211_length_487_cov_13.826484_g3607_i0:2-208(-)
MCVCLTLMCVCASPSCVCASPSCACASARLCLPTPTLPAPLGLPGRGSHYVYAYSPTPFLGGWAHPTL